jgi:predicted transcriptional regulator
MTTKRNLKQPILKLRKQGHSYNEITAILGCSKSLVSYYCGVGQPQKSINRQNDSRTKISKYVARYKDSKPCTDCKVKFRHWMLTFDHLHDKEFNISQFRDKTKSLKKVKAEIKKCELVCPNCHAHRTYLRRRYGSLLVNVSPYPCEAP